MGGPSPSTTASACPAWASYRAAACTSGSTTRPAPRTPTRTTAASSASLPSSPLPSPWPLPPATLLPLRHRPAPAPDAVREARVRVGLQGHRRLLRQDHEGGGDHRLLQGRRRQRPAHCRSAMVL